MSHPDRGIHPVVDSTAVFKQDIFKNKVLFCTGGGSGICRVMTEAVVRNPSLHIACVRLMPSNLDAARRKCHHRWTKVRSQSMYAAFS